MKGPALISSKLHAFLRGADGGIPVAGAILRQGQPFPVELVVLAQFNGSAGQGQRLRRVLLGSVSSGQKGLRMIVKTARQESIALLRLSLEPFGPGALLLGLDPPSFREGALRPGFGEVDRGFLQGRRGLPLGRPRADGLPRAHHRAANKRARDECRGR